jgi:VIT1/CCC1 family predicted Fe2+/Mn2+ transporter
MDSTHTDNEHHFIHRTGWLRAFVLGANDGIVSTASLVIGVAAASASAGNILIAGVAALVAGSMSMAAGEYVSVSSQADTEKADLETERQALIDSPEQELQELAGIYEARGLKPELALEVAVQLTEKDALKAHARDELGLSTHARPRPIQAALVSAGSFALGAALPLIAAIVAPLDILTGAVAAVSLISLAALGFVSATIGGAPKGRAMLRILFWGAAAMIITGAIGHVFGTII